MHNVYYDASMDFFNLNAAPNTFDTTDTPLCTVLVCDVVESVRWMQANEAAAVAQWQTFIEKVKAEVLPKHGARLVKSLGDGLMLEFSNVDGLQATPSMALQAAFALQSIALGLQGSAPFQLRIGMHHTPVTVGEYDIYGHGVNLCARIAALAGVGEVIVSSEMRDVLVDQIDADIEDMGECYLKHIEAPIRVYRAGKASTRPVLVPEREYNTPLQATVAVIPFSARSTAADIQMAVGEIIADGVIGQLSRTRDLKVISRLSTSVFRNAVSSGHANNVASIESHLGANYVLSGSYIAHDKKLIVTAELAEAKTNQIVWMDRIEGSIGDLLQLQSELCNAIANAAHMEILNREVQAALIQPLPTLKSYALLIGANQLMHRQGGGAFGKARLLLEHLAEQHNRNATVAAWQAMWYVLANTRGTSQTLKQDASIALQLTQRALRFEDSNSLAKAVEGFVYCHLVKDQDIAKMKLLESIAINPNESLAYLFLCTVECLLGNVNHGLAVSQKALHLSPLDPEIYYYHSLAGSAYVYCADYKQALRHLEKSHKLHSGHLSTIKSLAICYSELKDMEKAKSMMRLILQIQPHLTESIYLTGFATPSVFKEIFSKALVRAGLPIH